MNRRALTKVLLIAAVLLLAIVAMRWLRPTSNASVASRAGADIVRLHDTSGFTLGRLSFAPCELAQRNSAATTSAFCAPFRVPENWDKPDGRMIDLKLALVRSDAQAAERDPVVLLAGGPGQAATEAYPRIEAGFAPLLRHRNLLLLDQRGTGGSHALVCKDSPTDFDTAAVEEIDLGQGARADARLPCGSVPGRRSRAVHDERGRARSRSRARSARRAAIRSRRHLLRHARRTAVSARAIRTACAASCSTARCRTSSCSAPSLRSISTMR